MRTDKICTSLYKKTGNFCPQNLGCANSLTSSCNNVQNNLNENLHGGAAGAFSKEAAAGMKTLAFTSIIDIWELKERRDKREALAQSSVKNICQTMQNVQNEDKPDIKPLLSKARKIKQNVYPILNRFENVYEDANDIVGRFSRVYHADIFPSNFIKNEDKIIELDSNKKPIREAQFEGDMPHIIKDYKKSAIMIYEAEQIGRASCRERV